MALSSNFVTLSIPWDRYGEVRRGGQRERARGEAGGLANWELEAEDEATPASDGMKRGQAGGRAGVLIRRVTEGNLGGSGERALGE